MVSVRGAPESCSAWIQFLAKGRSVDPLLRHYSSAPWVDLNLETWTPAPCWTGGPSAVSLDGIHTAAGVGAAHPAHGRQLPPPLRQAPARAHPRRALAFQSGWVVDRPASAAARRLRRRTEDGSEHMDVRERDEARRRRGARPSGPAQAPPRRGRGRALVRLVRGAAIRRHRSARRVPGDDAAGRATRVLHVVKGSARVVRAVRARRCRARQCRVGLLRAGGRARAAPRETGAHGRRGASWHVAEVGRLAHEARAKARPPRRSPAEARGA